MIFFSFLMTETCINTAATFADVPTSTQLKAKKKKKKN